MRDYILLSQNDYNHFIVRNFEQIKYVATPLKYIPNDGWFDIRPNSEKFQNLTF